jgi:hypothetical protein
MRCVRFAAGDYRRTVLDRRQIFAIPGRVELATERCDLSCDWCGFCRGRDIPAPELQRLWSAPPPADSRVLRIRGGDPFRYGDLSAWVAWARRDARAAVCIEGRLGAPAEGDRAAVVARIAAAARCRVRRVRHGRCGPKRR